MVCFAYAGDVDRTLEWGTDSFNVKRKEIEKR